MMNEVYLNKNFKIKMPFNETTVLLGGIMHIPVIIVIFRLIENRFKINEIGYQKSN